jgi:hypothetical protein
MPKKGRMTALSTRVLATLVLLLATASGTAVAAAVFSGLSELIDSSDHIVLAMILTEPRSIRTATFDDAQPQLVQIVHPLKGSLAPNAEATVALRTALVLGGGEFNAMERYVLFLKEEKGTYRLAGGRGSAFRVSEASDVSTLRNGDARANIEILLRDAVADAKDRARTFENQAEEYLKPRPTATAAQRSQSARRLATSR